MISLYKYGIIILTKFKIMEVKDRIIDNLIVKCSEKMAESGYSQGIISTHVVRWKLHLRPFLAGNGTSVYELEWGRKFLAEKLPSLSPASQRRFKRSVRILDAFVTTGEIPKHSKRTVPFSFSNGIGGVVKDFIDYKSSQRCMMTTIDNYKRLLSYFIQSLEMKGKDGIAQIAESDVLEFLGVKESNRSRHSVIRQFYEYVGLYHPEVPNYSYLFEFIHQPIREKNPSTYSKEEIEAIESSVNRCSDVGKRTYAMLLLSSRLGLRISDIIGLGFPNIDWDKSLIRLRQAKTGNPIELPLLKDVGEAIISYLKVRPECECEEIFVTHTPPVTRMSRAGAARLISNAIQRSGVESAGRKHGPHSMRFSLASRMLEQGVGIPVISESLGHTGQDVTMNYLRIDIQKISFCMLDVPPVNEDFYEQQNGTFFI